MNHHTARRTTTLVASLAATLSPAFATLPSLSLAASPAQLDTVDVYPEDSVFVELATGRVAANYGDAVALDGQTLFVGSAEEDDQGLTRVGRVDLFQRGPDGWIPDGYISCIPLGAGSFDNCGDALAVDGDTLVVGAPRTGSSVGAAYVFRRGASGWVGEAQLTGSDDDIFDSFGISVAVEGDRILVGKSDFIFQNSPGGPGAVYAFERTGSTWTQTQMITASDGRIFDRFGATVRMVGDRAVIGALGVDGGASNEIARSGAAYVFEHNGTEWVETAKLEQETPQDSRTYGAYLALGDDQIILSPRTFPGEQGILDVWRYDGMQWAIDQVLMTTTAGPATELGRRDLLLEGDRLLASATGPATSLTNGAHVVQFRERGGQWIEETVLRPVGNPEEDEFGGSLAIGPNGTVAVAAPRAKPFFWYPATGVVYSFQPDEHVNTYCVSSVNSTGVAAWVGASGSLRHPVNALTVTASGVPAGGVGLFVYGAEAAQTPLASGTLCVGGPQGFGRFPEPSFADASGVARHLIDLGSGPFENGPNRIAPGSTWHFQYWFRDPQGGGAAFNLTDGIRLRFEF